MSPLPSGLTSIDDLLGGNGYPDRSTIIIVGKAEVDKELILYPFILEGARRGDFCLYVSRHSVDEVLRDAKAAGFDLTDKGIFWIAEEGGQLKYSANDLSRLSYDIKDLLGKNRGRRIRIAADVLSSLLLFNPHETIYRFLSQLFTEFRQYHGVVIMTLDEGMHDQHAATAMEEIFDGVLCLTYNLQQGLQVELRKMKSLPVEARHRQIAIGTITPSLMNVESTQLSKSRIAVLPFTNISPDPKDEYFADGITEELISTLSRIRELRVISRTSVMRYKRTEKSLSEIARELNVSSVLEGSVRKMGDDLRITAQLIDVQNDEHLWSEDYDRKFENVFSLQKEIAQKVADSLQVTILAKESKELGKKPTQNMEAYILYLKGRSHRHRLELDSLKRTINYCEQAIQKDPNYAQAYAEIARSYALVGFLELQPSSEVFPRAERLLKRQSN